MVKYKCILVGVGLADTYLIDSSGNVGVGTQDGTIGAKLHVVGGIYATGDVTAYYFLILT